MANLYGVANPNPPPLGASTIGAAPVTCPAGVETNVCTVPAINPTLPGVFYPAMWGSLAIVFGASTPTLLVIGFRINNGADLSSLTVHGGFYVASTSFLQTFFDYNTAFVVSNPTGVWNFQVSVNPTTNGVTVQPNSTQLIAQWLRATDQ